MTHLQAVKDAVIAKVPEIAVKNDGLRGGYVIRPVSLADVLQTLNKTPGGGYYLVDAGGAFWDWSETLDVPNLTGIHWNLSLPLDSQEPRVIDFLYALLVEKV